MRPAAFAPSGLFGAGAQSAAWLYVVWHVGFALFVIGYALLRDFDRKPPEYNGPAAGTIGSVVAIVIALVWPHLAARCEVKGDADASDADASVTEHCACEVDRL